MNTKTIIAAVVGAVAAFLLGWLIWGVLLMDYFTENIMQYEGLMKEPPMIPLIFVANLANGFLFAWIFNRMNIHTLYAGFQAGAIIGFLLELHDIVMDYAFLNWFENATVIAVELVVTAVFAGIIGAVIAWLLGRGTKTAYA